jgi:hypothetical protein
MSLKCIHPGCSRNAVDGNYCRNHHRHFFVGRDIDSASGTLMGASPSEYTQSSRSTSRKRPDQRFDPTSGETKLTDIKFRENPFKGGLE